MRAVSNLELKRLIDEISVVNGSYLSKAFAIANDIIKLRFRSGQLRYNLMIYLPYAVFLTDADIREYTSNGFVNIIRDKLDNAYLESISQVGDDRVIELSFVKGDNRYKIYIELFGKGNIILKTDDAVYRYKDNVKEVQYKTEKIEESKILEVYNKDDSIIRSLMEIRSIGSIYIEDLLLRERINPKEKVKSISIDLFKKLIDDIDKDAESRLKDKAYLYSIDGNDKDFSLGLIEKYKSYSYQLFDSLNSLIELLYLEKIYSLIESIKTSSINEKAESYIKSIEKQRSYLEALNKEIDDYRRAGAIIMNRMYMLNQVIDIVKRNEREELSKLKELLKDYNIELININKKDKYIEIDIDD